MLTILQSLSETRTYYYKVRDPYYRGRIIVGVEVLVEERLGRGERVVLPSYIQVSYNNYYIGIVEDKGAISDLNYIKEVKISKYFINELGVSLG